MPQTPAPEREQVVSYPTPQLLDRHLLERVSAKIGRYKPLQPGTPHPNPRDFAGYVLLKTLPPAPTDPDWYLRIYTNGRVNQDTYNAEVSYAEESNAHPIFLREYLELRPYTAIAKGAALAGITDAKTTAGGTGFDQNTAAIVLAGGTGSGGVILPVVINGAITRLIIVTPGSYTVAPTLSATGGSGWTGTAYVQPQTAVLVKEETGRLEDEMDALYVKVRRIYETLPGPPLAGQEFDRRTGLAVAYTEQVRATADAPAAKTEVTPIDSVKRNHRTVTTPTSGELDALAIKVFGYESFDLPDVLTGVTITYNVNFGEGSHSEDGDGVSVGDNASLTLHLSSRAQSSASVMADAQPIIRKYRTDRVPTMHYFFYMPASYTQAQLLSRLDDADLANAAVAEWPSFKEESVVLTLKGQQVSVAANADVQQHVSISEGNTSYTWGEGSGNSKETGVSIKTMLIPPTIHGAITYTGATSTPQAIEAEAAADLGGVVATNWPDHAITAPSTTATATASVAPTSIGATSGLTAIPTTGLYLLDVIPSPHSDWAGFTFVHAKVVDFLYFA